MRNTWHHWASKQLSTCHVHIKAHTVHAPCANPLDIDGREPVACILLRGAAQKLTELKEADAAVCSDYGANLANDATKLYFTPEELAGCGQVRPCGLSTPL